MYYPTLTDIVEQIMKKENSGGKPPNKQHILKIVNRIEKMGFLQ